MNSFFPNVTNEWNKLDIKIMNITSHNICKTYLLSFIRPFKHSFHDFLNPLCACNLEPETTSHYLLRCHLFQTERRTLLNDIKEIDENIVTEHKNDLDQIFLYGNGCYRYDTNRMILLSTIKFCIDSKTFDLPLFYFALYI